MVKFDWPYLIACPPKHPVRCKGLGDIAYTDRFIAHFVSSFVTMATEASQG